MRDVYDSGSKCAASPNGFPGVLANDQIDFQLEKSGIHARKKCRETGQRPHERVGHSGRGDGAAIWSSRIVSARGKERTCQWEMSS